MLTKWQPERFTLVSILAKYGKLLPEQNTHNCLSKFEQLFSWCHDDACRSRRPPWLLVSWLVNTDLQCSRNIYIFMSLPYTH